MDYSKALSDLKPVLRRRLRAVARIADMSELEALRTIVESSQDPTDDDMPLTPTEDQR